MERISQAKLEELKAIVLDGARDNLCKMMLIRIIQASEGLTASRRAVIRVPSRESFPEAIEALRELSDDLNDMVKKLGASGKFRWNHEEGYYVIWYDPTGEMYNFHDVDREVGDFRGERSQLAVSFRDGLLPDGICEVEVTTGRSFGVSQRLPVKIAIITVLELLDMMPEIKVYVHGDTIADKEEVNRVRALLLQTSEERDLLKKEARSPEAKVKS